MKNGKKIAMFAIAAAVTATGVVAMSACGGGGSAIAGTYTINYTTAEISGNVEMNGYLVALECTETNTLVLNEDNTYEYTKHIESHRDVSMYASAASYSVSPLADETDENLLFSWTSAGDGACTLDFNKDGTYEFSYTTMGLKEEGTWTWDNWTMTLTQSNGTEIAVTMDSATNSLNVHYVAVAGGGQLYHDFVCDSSVWGVAFGGQGSYTPVSANLLFAWTSAGDGACTLEFFKDGTYEFVYTTMGLTEEGTWTWDNWTMTLTQSNGTEIAVTMDETTNALSVHYVAVAGGGQLYHDFVCDSSVWGTAFGGQGSYTPVEGGNDDDEEEETPGTDASGPVVIEYVFSGTYSVDEDGNVVLAPATGCTWSENWGVLKAYGGFVDCSGDENDMVVRTTAGVEVDPLGYFGGNLFYSSGNTEVTVELDIENATFDYVIKSAFD